MSESEQPAVVAQGSLAGMRELQDKLGARGLASELVRPPEGKGSS